MAAANAGDDYENDSDTESDTEDEGNSGDESDGSGYDSDTGEDVDTVYTLSAAELMPPPPPPPSPPKTPARPSKRRVIRPDRLTCKEVISVFIQHRSGTKWLPLCEKTGVM